MNGKNVIVALKKKLRVGADRDLASRLGFTVMSIQNWKNRLRITPRQIAGLIHSASKAATTDHQMTALRPLVEFFKIEKRESPRGAKYELFSIKDKRGRQHPYRAGLRDELDKFCGVYVFFDSRGQAIYTGKAKRQSL